MFEDTHTHVVALYYWRLFGTVVIITTAFDVLLIILMYVQWISYNGMMSSIHSYTHSTSLFSVHRSHRKYSLWKYFSCKYIPEDNSLWFCRTDTFQLNDVRVFVLRMPLNRSNRCSETQFLCFCVRARARRDSKCNLVCHDDTIHTICVWKHEKTGSDFCWFSRRFLAKILIVFAIHHSTLYWCVWLWTCEMIKTQTINMRLHLCRVDVVFGFVDFSSFSIQTIE